VHEPRGIACRQQCAAKLERAPDAIAEKAGVDLGSLPAPHPRRDLRWWVAGGNRQELAVGTVDFDGVARFRRARESSHCPREYPGVAAFQRFLASGLEYQFVHAFFAPGSFRPVSGDRRSP
jgi:hypothetical protein